jgi:solute carrier family 45 protein 1/2/4
MSSTLPSSYRRLSTHELSPITPASSHPLHLLHTPSSPTSSSLRLEDSSTGELSGLYFGILNIYTTLPQFVGTFISMIVFSILEPGKSPELAHHVDKSEHHGTEGPNAIAVCLFIGAVSTVGAAWATKKLKDLQ